MTNGAPQSKKTRYGKVPDFQRASNKLGEDEEDRDEYDLEPNMLSQTSTHDIAPSDDKTTGV